MTFLNLPNWFVNMRLSFFLIIFIKYVNIEAQKWSFCLIFNCPKWYVLGSFFLFKKKYLPASSKLLFDYLQISVVSTIKVFFKRIGLSECKKRQSNLKKFSKMVFVVFWNIILFQGDIHFSYTSHSCICSF